MSEGFSADMNAALPPHTILSTNLVVGEDPIPVTAEINGKKVQVGTGHLDPETGLFHATFDGVYGEIMHHKITKGTRIITDAQIHSVSLVSERPDPSRGIYPVTIIEGEKISDALHNYHNKEKDHG
jgi:hypothetical protein